MKLAWNTLTRHPRRATGVICLLIFVLASMVSLGTRDVLRYPDEMEYHQLAQNLSSGAGYINSESQPTAFRPPGYPLVLCCLYKVWPHPLAAKLLNGLALACAAWLISLLVAQVAPEGRLVAAILFLLYPLFLYASSTLYPQIVGTLLLAAAFLGLVRSPSSAGSVAGSGCLLGFLILTIPSFILLVPVVAIFLLSAPSSTRSRPFRQFLLCLFCMTLVISPWTLRNALQFKRFIPVSTNSGLNLLVGNSETTTAKSGVNVDISSQMASAASMNEVARDDYFKRAAVEWVVTHPFRALALYARKVTHYFGFRDVLFVRAEESTLRNTILFIIYYPLLALALIRLALWRRYPFSRTEFLLYVFYFGNAFLSAIFFTRIRFRIPFDALLIGITAIFLGRLCASSKATLTRD